MPCVISTYNGMVAKLNLLSNNNKNTKFIKVSPSRFLLACFAAAVAGCIFIVSHAAVKLVRANKEAADIEFRLKKTENNAAAKLSEQNNKRRAASDNKKANVTAENTVPDGFPDKVSEYDDEKPPVIQIVAVMKTENKIAACVNIKGIAEGIILVPGMNLFDHGEVAAIDETGIRWTWNGKQRKTDLEK